MDYAAEITVTWHATATIMRAKLFRFFAVVCLIIKVLGVCVLKDHGTVYVSLKTAKK